MLDRMLFFDVRVFHPNAPSNRSGRLSAVCKRHKDEKKRVYGQRILDVEHGVFTPLILSTTGGMEREAQTFYKRLADMLSNRREVPYSMLMGWLRCKLSFAILRSASEEADPPGKGCYRHSPCLLGGLCAPAVVTEITMIYFTFPFTQSYPLVTNSYTVYTCSAFIFALI